MADSLPSWDWALTWCSFSFTEFCLKCLRIFLNIIRQHKSRPESSKANDFISSAWQGAGVMTKSLGIISINWAWKCTNKPVEGGGKKSTGRENEKRWFMRAESWLWCGVCPCGLVCISYRCDEAVINTQHSANTILRGMLSFNLDVRWKWLTFIVWLNDNGPCVCKWNTTVYNCWMSLRLSKDRKTEYLILLALL